ncbi:hypothetical protein CBM2589_B30095 [Cupriavidus taiwanensis]|uniref:Uncharacterized protein n=1 Tax=Cupriavidus taiwanensis TaxID=164546 RepID=A0A975X2G6_9BURK|nr:hypothetical protein CBM2589_B30095 [Cupriavidus taiwanensis]
MGTIVAIGTPISTHPARVLRCVAVPSVPKGPRRTGNQTAGRERSH